MTRLLSRRSMLAGAAAVSTAPLWPRASQAADWRPTETVRIIVPAAAGGSTDVIGRYLAQHLQSVWGQSAIVENKSGGGGTIGTTEFLRAKPDGHTILVGNPGPNAVAYSIFRSLPYKSEQLQPVSNVIRIPNIVSAHPNTGIKSIAELVAFLKANPDKLNYGTSGVGQSPHLTAVWFMQLTGVKMQHIPFRGAGPALAGALSGDISILFDNLYPSLPQAEDGKLVALAVTTPERSFKAHRQNIEASKRQGIYGIGQGGQFEDLRRESTRTIGQMGFDGFGLGGAFNKIDGKSMLPLALSCLDELPGEMPVHGLGVGEPTDLLMAIAAGVDTFDCVSPTRHGRHGSIYTRRGPINLTNEKYVRDFSPLDPETVIPGTEKFTKAYVCHLLRNNEMLGQIFASIHNLGFLIGLVEGSREAILAGTFEHYRADFERDYVLTK